MCLLSIVASYCTLSPMPLLHLHDSPSTVIAAPGLAAISLRVEDNGLDCHKR